MTDTRIAHVDEYEAYAELQRQVSCNISILVVQSDTFFLNINYFSLLSFQKAQRVEREIEQK